MFRQLHLPALALAMCLAAPPGVAAQVSFEDPSGLPLWDWLAAGEVEELRWDLDISRAALRMDQRLEVVIHGRIRGRDLEDTGDGHELSLRAWVANRGQGDEREAVRQAWIGGSGPIRHSVEDGLPANADVEFDIQVLVTPGDYTFWILLVDETTGQHSLKVERVRVDEVSDDPFPGAFADVPRIEFPDMDWREEDDAVAEASGDLIMPVRTSRPIDVELIAGMSIPEQWSSLGAGTRHIDNITDTLIALSQLDLERGTLSIRGVDLVGRRHAFEQRGMERLDLEGLGEAFESTNPGFVTVEDLANRMDNPKFFRDVVEETIADHVGAGGVDPTSPLKVLVFVMGVTRFDDDAEVERIRLDGDCDCLAYHIRIRQNLQDLFDQIGDVIGPLDPETYNVLHPEDLRRAIGRIVGDLGRY